MEEVELMDAGPDFLAKYGVCGYKNRKQDGYQKKLSWLKERYKEGLRTKVLYSEKDGLIGSTEYMPGEYTWRAIQAPGYLVIQCLFILKRAYKGQGLGTRMVMAFEKDAKEAGMHGVAVVTSRKTWMAKKDLFLKLGYDLIEEAPPHYELLVKRFQSDAPLPSFTGKWKEKLKEFSDGLTILYANQCPYVAKAMNEIPPVARKEFGVEPRIVQLKSAEDVRNSPNPFGVFSIILNGELVADHPISATRFRNIMNKKISKS